MSNRKPELNPSAATLRAYRRKWAEIAKSLESAIQDPGPESTPGDRAFAEKLQPMTADLAAKLKKAGKLKLLARASQGVNIAARMLQYTREVPGMGKVAEGARALAWHESAKADEATRDARAVYADVHALIAKE